MYEVIFLCFCNSVIVRKKILKEVWVFVFGERYWDWEEVGGDYCFYRFKVYVVLIIYIFEKFKNNISVFGN